MMPIQKRIAILAFTITFAALANVVAAPLADDTIVKEPPVPKELLGRGVVYHTLADRQAQVTFTSKAPLENIVGQTNKVVGWAMAGRTDNPAALIGATWLLPVNTLATGIPLRDEHMISEEWLGGKDHPVIRFTLTKTEDVTLVKTGDGYSTWSATLVGDMTLRGVKKPLRVPNARLSFLKESERTRAIAPGDLLFIKCDYAVKISDFGIHHKDVPDKVSDSIAIKQVLRLSTVKPKEDAHH